MVAAKGDVAVLEGVDREHGNSPPPPSRSRLAPSAASSRDRWRGHDIDEVISGRTWTRPVEVLQSCHRTFQQRHRTRCDSPRIEAGNRAR
jgi:hypothetical protein